MYKKELKIDELFNKYNRQDTTGKKKNQSGSSIKKFET